MKAKAKKLFTSLLVITLVVTQFSPFVGGALDVFAVEDPGTGLVNRPKTIATKYFYEQLENNNQQVFYKAMETMLEKGFFKQGNVSMEVNGIEIADEQILLRDMGAARDAFLLDYPELFYVDFDYLSLRGEYDERNQFHIYLGTGRGDNYINQEFLSGGKVNDDAINTAISTVNSRIDAIVNEAKKKGSIREQIKYAHDEVIKAAKYTLEYKTNHPYSVRTIYGVFGSGNAVCEGYARALKTILDRLGIPAILVRGVYDNIKDNKLEEHMWVYVQIDGVWYGVDPTFDNTDDERETSGNVSDKYLIVSADGMNYHYPFGVISSSDFEFTYPDLDGGVSQNKYKRKEGDNVVYSDAAGLTVIDAGSEELGEAKPKPEKVFHISYNGKGYAKAAAEDGVYMITNSWQVKHNNKTGKDDVLPSEWQYPSDVMDYKLVYEDHDDYLAMRVDNITAIQVGLTDVEPEEPTLENLYDVFYKGGDNGIVAMSTDIDTGVGKIDYAQPFPVKSTPSQQLAYKVGKNKSYDIEITYDQDLIFVEKEKEKQKIAIDLKIYDNIYGYREPDEQYLKYEITEPVLKDSRTIAFTIKPSELWTMDKVQYMV